MRGVSGDVSGEVDKTSGWRDLEASLDGAFSARARGFLGSEFSLRGRDGEFGFLRLEGSEGASFEAGGSEGRIEAFGSKYRMFIGGEEALTAERGRSGIRMETGGGSLEATVSPVLNSAEARSTDDREVARVSGGLMNRSYEAAFEGGNLAVAVFLFHYVAAVRRRAFRVAGTAGGEVK